MEAFTTDERMGTNAMILATENFDSIEVSTLKFNHLIIAEFT
jgi:hypothetical protein